MKWLRRFAVIGAASLLLSAGPGSVASGDVPALFGYDMGAISNAVSFIYNQPSFGLPAKPTFEFHHVHADTFLDSASGHALGSVLWPGDVVGNAPAATAFDIFLSDPTAAGYLKPALDPIRQGASDGAKDSPPYPIRSETTYPPGGSPEPTDLGGGVTMQSKALSDESLASATMQHAGFPGAFQIGAMHSDSFSGLRKGLAVAEARTHMTDVDIAGEIHIEQLDTIAMTTSDGVRATATGSLKIVGMSIHGTPMVYDATGLHAGGQDIDPFGMIAKDIIQQYLAPQGISITFDKPTGIVDGAAGQLSTAGVVIRMDSHAMRTMVDSLPEPLPGWIRHPATSPLSPIFDQFTNSTKGYTAAPFQFDGDTQIVLGSVGVRGAASPSFDFTIPDVTVPDVIVPPPNFGGGFVSGPIVPPTQVLGTKQTAPSLIHAVGVVGIPAAGSAALLLLLGIIAVVRMRRFADRIDSATGPSCPLDDGS